MTNNKTPKSITNNSGQVPGNLPPKHLHVIGAKASKGKSHILQSINKYLNKERELNETPRNSK